MPPINLSILDFKAIWDNKFAFRKWAINLSILDFKENGRLLVKYGDTAINLSILDFKVCYHFRAWISKRL